MSRAPSRWTPIRSAPAPPSIVSRPSPPTRKSAPARPAIRSLPPLPWIESAADVPLSVSARAEPRIVAPIAAWTPTTAAQAKLTAKHVRRIGSRLYSATRRGSNLRLSEQVGGNSVGPRFRAGAAKLVCPRGHSSAGRASGWQPEGRRFEPGWLHQVCSLRPRGPGWGLAVLSGALRSVRRSTPAAPRAGRSLSPRRTPCRTRARNLGSRATRRARSASAWSGRPPR